MDHHFGTVEETVRFSRSDTRSGGSDLIVTIFDGDKAPYSITLRAGGGRTLRFGRRDDNDIVLSSGLVSRSHGRFEWFDRHWRIVDAGSKNGLIFNERNVSSHILQDGDIIRIDDAGTARPDGVLFLFSFGDSADKWRSFPIRSGSISIGRSPDCNIVLPHISVSKLHARILYEGGRFVLVDNGSTNGLVLNQQQISGRCALQEKDVISITNSRLIFTSRAVYYCTAQRGISVDVADVVVRRGSGSKSFITSDHVSMHVRPGELIAVIGGSGAGKSTILNCMCGYLKPTQGHVYINGVDLYRNFDTLKKAIGYVPQSDIVYDNLTLYDMLNYTAKLRLPDDVSPAERERTIATAIETVELTEKRNSLIKSLSGGQRKRASIAVELLSDPNLLFLDEPASGLDPGTERSLMRSLRRMADGGKTVILVTHSTLQLEMCDKIVFMGRGGKLCFFGSYHEALRFFRVDNVIDIYAMITDNAESWSARYNALAGPIAPPRASGADFPHRSKGLLKQLGILQSRYLKLVTNDRQRLLLLLVQAPVLAMLISFVGNGEQFEDSFVGANMARNLLFALSCSAFWVGMLNAIQEICKERSVLKREYMTGLSLTSYLCSKIVVLGLMCAIQSLLLVSVFVAMVGQPDEGMIYSPFTELFFTTFLSALASSAMGLFVSSLFNNPDRAMTVAPILLMPQILFSGIVFSLDGTSETLSWFTVCRWCMEGYGTTANLSKQLITLDNVEVFYERTPEHLRKDWLILIAITLGFLLLARLFLSNIGKDKN